MRQQGWQTVSRVNFSMRQTKAGRPIKFLLLLWGLLCFLMHPMFTISSGSSVTALFVCYLCSVLYVMCQVQQQWFSQQLFLQESNFCWGFQNLIIEHKGVRLARSSLIGCVGCISSLLITFLDMLAWLWLALNSFLINSSNLSQGKEVVALHFQREGFSLRLWSLEEELFQKRLYIIADVS